MFAVEDTIVALATPVGRGALGIVRLSGPSAIDLLQKVFSPCPAPIKSHHFYLGHLIPPTPKGAAPLDQVLAVCFSNPHSFTGEDVVEIHAHGNPLLLTQIISLFQSMGARLAEPGEFSKRAYLNGKMDLSQAEAVCDLIQADNQWAAQNALSQLGGFFSRTIGGLREQILDFLSRLEAGFDFGEEDIQFIGKDESLALLIQLQSTVKGLLDSFHTGQIYKEGVRVALVGRPNVGKSSLMNALLREDRAIIHHEPGTTRDVIRGERLIGGLQFHFFDTAGIRATPHSVEKEGIRRTQEVLEKADLVLLLLDSSQPLTTEDHEMLAQVKNKNHLVLLNKCDLPCALNEKEYLPISAKQSLGLEELLQKIVEKTMGGASLNDHNYVLNNVRHKQCLEVVKGALDSLLLRLRHKGVTEDLLAGELRFLADQLSQITGEISSEEVLDEVFSRFCIGK